jgi:hypothetical protein
MIIATPSGYNIEFNVVNVHKFDNLAFGACVYIARTQLPRYEGMIKLGDNVLIGKHHGKLVYSCSQSIDTFLHAINQSVPTGFDNVSIYTGVEWNIASINLEVGKTLWFVGNSAVYECNVIGIFDPVDGECKSAIELNTTDLLDYINVSFQEEYKAIASKTVDESTRSQIEAELTEFAKELEQMNASISELAVNTELSIANDAFNASDALNTDNNMKASAPILEPVVVEPIAPQIAIACPEPESFIGLKRPSLSTYTLDDIQNIEKVELVMTTPMLIRAVNPMGLKCWKVNHEGNVRVKLIFDKVIPACDLKLVRSNDAKKTAIGDFIKPLREDKCYDSVRTNIGWNEYIHFTANGLYIDVQITSVELTDE